jgi:hypothetical protein
MNAKVLADPARMAPGVLYPAEMLVAPCENAAVAVYNSASEAVAVVANLRQSDFDMSRVSVAGRPRSERQVIGCFDDGAGGVKYWGDQRELWAGLWEKLSGWALFTMPGIGPVLVAGPLSGWIAAGLENAAIFGGLSPIGAAIYSIEIPKGQILLCEAAVEAGKYLVLAHGTVSEVSRAREVLKPINRRK